MLHLKLTLLQDELDHDARDQRQRDRRHKNEIIRVCSLFKVLELLEYRVWLSGDIEVEVRVIGGYPQDGLVYVVREHGGHIRRRHVQITNDLVQVGLFVGRVDLVRSVSIWVQRLIISRLIYLIVKVKVV